MEGVLTYPKKSHRKQIAIPRESARLAELMGVVLGDGGINNKWQVVVTLNAILDLSYSSYVSQLFVHLFNIETARLFRKNEKTLRVVCSSMNLVDFLVSVGAVRGDKIKNGISVPPWVLGKSLYERAFVRGLVDTDGCLYMHRHVVGGRPQFNLGFCFTSWAPKLLKGVASIFEKNGIEPHITDKGRRIYLYSAKAIKKYLEVFGTSNERISGMYKQWTKIKNGEVA